MIHKIICIIHKWHLLKIQNFLPPFSHPVFQLLGTKTLPPGFSFSTSTPQHPPLDPRKKCLFAHTHTKTRTHIHIHTLIQTTLEQTTDVVTVNPLVTDWGWVNRGVLKSRQRKPSSIQQNQFSIRFIYLFFFSIFCMYT